VTTEQYSIGYNAGYQDGFDAALAQPVKQEPVAVEQSAPYGFCPICRRAGVSRERRINGNDTCVIGHKYASSEAIPAEPVKQEPVAVISESAIGLVKLHSNGACLPFGTQLYAAPIEHQWVDLTDDEIDEAYEQAGKALRRWQSSVHGQTVSPANLLNTHFAWAVIAAFKEKNK